MAKKTNIVKKAKGNINLLLIVLLVMSVLCALVALTSDDSVEQQNALIEQAEVYLEDKLYIRAINNYKNAISNYSTERNSELEIELLALYKEAGMMADYYDFIETRIEENKAQESEYMEIAQMYIDGGSARKAIPILNTGIEKFDNEEMRYIKEQILYPYKVKSIILPEIKMPNADWCVSYFDGNKWGYAYSDGKAMLDCIYEEAIHFSGNYSVVKLNGLYTRIDKQGNWWAVDKIGLDNVADISSNAIIGVKDGKYLILSLDFNKMTDQEFDCVYVNDNGLYVVQQGGKWAVLNSSFEPITDYIFTDVAVNCRGQVFTGDYAVVKDEGGYFVINKEGQAMYEARFREAKGYEGGLHAVSNDGVLWGFADNTGEVVINYNYTDAYSFSSGLGAVKYAGKWGYINRFDEMMIEADFATANPFIGENALATNDAGEYKIITLKLYEYIK